MMGLVYQKSSRFYQIVPISNSHLESMRIGVSVNQLFGYLAM